MFDSVDIQPKSKHNPNFPIRPVVIPIGPSIAYVQLTRGLYSLIDADDALVIGRYNWHAKLASPGSDKFYARRHYRDGNRKRGAQGMHSFLVGRGADHVNTNGLDNRRSSNLRQATKSQNNMNRGIQRNNTSGLKGASWHAATKSWQAVIAINSKLIYLGNFSTVEKAHEAYCVAAKSMHGEFARVA